MGASAPLGYGENQMATPIFDELLSELGRELSHDLTTADQHTANSGIEPDRDRERDQD